MDVIDPFHVNSLGEDTDLRPGAKAAANDPPQGSSRPPPLREELHLFPGPRGKKGNPTWTLLDPATNQFYRIGWREFEILCRWRRGEPDRIAELVSKETTLETTTGDVTGLVRFLLGASLLRPQGEPGLARLNQHVKANQHSWLQQILHAYLFFRIPLFNPDRFLQRTLPWISWAFSRKFFIASGIAALTGLHMMTRQWEIAVATFSETNTITKVLFVTLAMFLTKAIHELGHAYTAVRYGCRVPTIGVAFLMLLPVLYTDTSDVWKLPSRQQRLTVAAGGILAELLLTAWGSLIWGMLPLGGVKDALFFIATVSWVSTLILNASPFLRFDGYYLLSDWLGIENLHDRAGHLGRWKLREMLLGLGAPFPEAALYENRRFLIFFAWLTWIYRLFLYFGIALAVYHLFFKVLGIILMSFEIGWFLVRPIVGEIGFWLRPATRIQFNSRVLISLMVLMGLISLLFIPWKGSIHAPALLQRIDQVSVYAPAPATIQIVSVTEGSQVKKGEILLQLHSPDLENQRSAARLKVEMNEWKLNFRGANPTLLEQSPVINRELAIDLTRYQELERQYARLRVTAPIDGRVTFLEKDVKPGVWVADGEPLLNLAHAELWQVNAYVRETDLSQIHTGATATFIPEGLDWPPMECRVTSVDSVAVTTLDEPALASLLGGRLPVRRDEKGRLNPTTSIYRVVLQPVESHTPAPPFVLRGNVMVEKQTSSTLVAYLHRTITEIFIHETMF